MRPRLQGPSAESRLPEAATYQVSTLWDPPLQDPLLPPLGPSSTDSSMSLAHTAAEYMLSDALLPDRKGPRLKGLRLELPLDRMVKFVAVGFPLLLMSLAFAQEFSSGEWLPSPSRP